jgi:hypothetical protein
VKSPWRVVGSLALAVGLGAPAGATVVDGPEVAGYRTFIDENTSRLWLDLDNFSDDSYTAMASKAAAAGFQVATREEVEVLLAGLPLESGQWYDYAPVMGRSPDRELIWGAYLSVYPGTVAWAFAFGPGSGVVPGFWQQWTFADDSGYGLDAIPPFGDMDLWAYRAVPEPAAVLLLGIGLLALPRRRRS